MPASAWQPSHQNTILSFAGCATHYPSGSLDPDMKRAQPPWAFFAFSSLLAPGSEILPFCSYKPPFVGVFGVSQTISCGILGAHSPSGGGPRAEPR